MSPDPVGIVGAGPAGLAAAEALDRAGIDFEVLERHEAIGGIWDIDNPGSPMYESAHFISSRTLSGFDGYPFHESLPDYPTRLQALDYLRSFARDRGLEDRITLDAEVESARRGPEGWEVRSPTAATGPTPIWSPPPATSGSRGCRPTPASSPARRSTPASTARPTSSAAAAC